MNDTVNFLCEICGSKKYSLSKKLTKRLVGNEKAKFYVVKCKKCNLHSLYPIPSDSDFKWIYNNYSSQGNRIEVEKLRIEKTYPAKIAKIMQYHSNPKVLDIGAGLGGFCFTSKMNGLQTVGIELEPEQVTLAKQIFDVELINLSIEDFLISNDQTFDVIHMHHVLEHLQNPKNTLFQIQKILSPEGIIILEVPNDFFVFVREIKIMLKLKIPVKPYNPYHHIYFFSPYTLRNLVESAGYNIYEFNQIPSNYYSIKAKIYRLLANISRMGYASCIEAVIGLKQNNNY